MRSTLVALSGIVVGFLVVFAFLRPRPQPATAVAPVPRGGPVASPLVRSERPAPSAGAVEGPQSNALFDRNRDMPADPDLASEYEELNDAFFSNILPPPKTRWESGLAELGPAIGEHFTVQGLTDGRLILLNPVVEHDRDQRRRALCHEMVHMAVWLQDTGHGPIFQERLRQLSLRGAFKGIVATDEERDATLETLRRQRAALETEDRGLVAERERLDRTSQAAVDAFNARVRAQQEAAAAYNRLVEQYNLMIAYPDGLARERLQPRGDGTVR